MKFDFDAVVNRQGTHSVKWDQMPGGGGEGVLPMWVADMDFPTAPAVREALEKRVAHGVFGYTAMTGDDWQAVMDWYRTRHGAVFQPQWLLSSPGVVPSLRAAVDALSRPGDRVVIQTPVYTPFFGAVRDQDRILVTNPLIREADGRWRMDLPHLERCFREGARLLLLCSPQNPTGRVWTAAELTALAELCGRYDVWVIADEIHCDFLRAGVRHTPFITVPGAERRTVALHSTTKTFNLGGLEISTAVIPDETARSAVMERLSRFGLSVPNLLAITAQTAAYRHGGAWVDALNAYMDGNLALLCDALNRTGLPCVRPEGTYLVWADCGRLGVTGEALRDFFHREAGLAVSEGQGYGLTSYARFNAAMPRRLIEEAVRRLEALGG